MTWNLLRSRAVLVCFGLVLGLLLGDDSRVADHQIELRAIRTSIDAGHYAEAERLAQTLISRLENQETRQPKELTQAMDLLVESLVWNGKGSDPRTRSLAEQTIRAREVRHGPNDLRLSLALRNLGDVLVQAGEYGLARRTYERGVGIREKNFVQVMPTRQTISITFSSAPSARAI